MTTTIVIEFLSHVLSAMRLESGRSGPLGGPRLVRPRPPYWNIVGRVACGEIGDAA